MSEEQIQSTEQKLLLSDEVHVWTVAVPQALSPTTYAAYEALLDEQEHERLVRIRKDDSRTLYVCAHAMQRSVLSQYAPVSPDEWKFIADDYGRPEISAAQNEGNLRFNLSHTRGLAALAVCRADRIGVDVETLERKNDIHALTQRYFAEEEIRQIFAHKDTEEQRARFFRIWTLKESFVKALGVGLRVSLKSFAFTLANDSGATLPRCDLPEESTIAWKFFQSRPSPKHYLSVAFHQGERPTTQIRHFEWAH